MPGATTPVRRVRRPQRPRVYGVLMIACALVLIMGVVALLRAG